MRFHELAVGICLCFVLCDCFTMEFEDFVELPDLPQLVSLLSNDENDHHDDDTNQHDQTLRYIEFQPEEG